MQKATIPWNFNYLIDRNMQENYKFMKSRVRLPILSSLENSEIKLKGDKFKVNVKRDFIKDCLIDLQISLSKKALRLGDLKD